METKKNGWLEKLSHYFDERSNPMPNAIQLLKEDHKKVKELFEQFEKTEDDGAKRQIVETTIHELEVHAAVEEEIFYPELREEIDEEEKVDEAEEEHHVMKLLLAELKKMGPGDERYDAKYKVLAESVKHHVEEEENEIFPEVEGELDNPELGQKMAERKQELQQEMSNGGSAKRRKKTVPRRSQKSARNGRAAARRP
jgi:hemerythrin-like domain-containing protein